MTENLYTPDSIRTFTGTYVNVFDPKPEMFCIEDIAHGLSHVCRFAGHTKRFYSVASHSLLVASCVPVEHRMAALLHDASEAYLGDIPAPFKNKFPNYCDVENRIMFMIATKFGFEYPLNEEVKKADKKALELEWETEMLKESNHFRSPTTAKQDFLMKYYTIRDFEILQEKREKVLTDVM